MSTTSISKLLYYYGCLLIHLNIIIKLNTDIVLNLASTMLTLIVPGDSWKSYFLLNSEEIRIFLLLYLSSIALKWKSMNTKVVKKKKNHVLSIYYKVIKLVIKFCFKIWNFDQFYQHPVFTAWKDQNRHSFVWTNAYLYKECRNKC